ncbi:phage portal protein [Nonomuraea sp. NPDC059023]|uniref:phage portal protein n=1 Tax=unclassified Nonomuraea TaxID=2593643 RepID=UPI0036AF57CF
MTLEEYISALQSYAYGSGFAYPVQQTLAGQPVETAGTDLVGYAQQAYAANGPVFALLAVRMAVFSSIRFAFQEMTGDRPGRLGSGRGLALLDRPWAGGTTQDLLVRMLLNRDLAGNAYAVRADDEVVLLRPDWVRIVLEPRTFAGGTLGYRRVGYLYAEGGQLGDESKVVALLPEEVCHFAAEPDPLATYRGMSWLTPVIREIINDKMMGRHQTAFFQNGATPNMVVRLNAAVDFDMFKRFKESFNLEHRSAENAYKTLFLGGGADVTVVGADFQQMSFTAVQGRGETRLAAAAGVPVTVVGFSEGLQGSSLNAGNYGQARRRFADGTMHPLWRNIAGSLQQIIPAPRGKRLWYDARDVPFLREDAKDIAEIQGLEASTIRQLNDAGYKPKSVVAAVTAQDWDLLEHSGLFSVQLQAPGTAAPTPDEADPAPEADNDQGDE